MHAFSYILAYSRREYVRFVEKQDFATTIRERPLIFGGLAATCLYDNMKVVVTGYDGDQPIYNSRFLASPRTMVFSPGPAVRIRPQMEHLNEVTAQWLAHTADVRFHHEIKGRLIDRFHEEKPHLLNLPARCYDTAQVLYRTVNREGHVMYRQNFYFVP